MRLRRLRIQILDYLDLVRWTAADAVLPLPWASLTMVGGGFAALAFQVNAVALTILFARNLGASTPLTLGPITLAPRERTLDLVIIAGGILVSMLLSTGARYAARLAELRIRERYADRCWSRGISLVRGPRSAPVGPVAYHVNEIQRLVRSDAILCSRFAVLLLQSGNAGIKLVLAGGTLLVVDPLLSTVILGIGVVFGAAAYRINLRSARISMAFEDSIPAARDETRDLLVEAASPIPPPDDDDDVIRRLPAKARYLSLYGLRLRTSDDSEAIGNLMLAVVLSFTVLGIGLRGDDWPSAATFLVALPYALLAFRELMRTTTSLNRFYPQVRRYRTFVQAFETADTPRTPGEIPDDLPDALPDHLMVGFARQADRATSPLPRARLNRGDIAIVHVPFMPDRHTAGWLVDTISEPGTPGDWSDAVMMATSRWPLDREHLERIGWTADEHARLVTLIGGMDRPLLLPGVFEEGGHLPNPNANTRPVLRLLIALVLATRSPDAALVLIDGRDLARLDATELDHIRRFLGERLVLAISPRNVVPIAVPEDTPVITVQDTRLTRIETLGGWRATAAELGLDDLAAGGDADEDDATVDDI